MANSKQALKRIRQNEVRRDRNRSYRSRMRTAMKNLRAAVEAGDRETAESLLAPTVKLIDSTASKAIIHRNTASRYKSRLTKAVRGIAS